MKGIQKLSENSVIVHTEICNGFVFFVVMHSIPKLHPWLCGYVVIPNCHPLSNVPMDYDYLDEIECHGGITFCEKIDTNVIIGFDCHHSCDEYNPKDLEFVIFECKNIINQL